MSDQQARLESPASSAGAETQGRARTGLRETSSPSAPETASRVPIGRHAEPASPGRTPLRSQGAASGDAPSTEPRPNLSRADTAVVTTGTLSEDPATEGMYVPPDFYHGNSYSPVFDRTDENGNTIRTPRFEGQIIYSDWRGSLPDDFDPNARVVRDPLTFDNSPYHWKKDEDGNWVRRETGYGGIPLYDDGTPMFTPDPLLYPEYWKV